MSSAMRSSSGADERLCFRETFARLQHARQAVEPRLPPETLVRSVILTRQCQAPISYSMCCAMDYVSSSLSQHAPVASSTYIACEAGISQLRMPSSDATADLPVVCCLHPDRLQRLALPLLYGL